jgi:hypothetical protein
VAAVSNTLPPLALAQPVVRWASGRENYGRNFTTTMWLIFPLGKVRRQAARTLCVPFGAEAKTEHTHKQRLAEWAERKLGLPRLTHRLTTTCPSDSIRNP